MMYNSANVSYNWTGEGEVLQGRKTKHSAERLLQRHWTTNLNIHVPCFGAFELLWGKAIKRIFTETNDLVRIWQTKFRLRK